MSERLERLKEIPPMMDANDNSFVSVDDKDYNWLIQQAERVEELEHEISCISRAHKANIKIAEYALEEKQRYKQALEKAKKQLLNDDLPLDECATEAYHTIDDALAGESE